MNITVKQNLLYICIMKALMIFLLTGAYLGIGAFVYAQVVYVTEYKSDADVVVYITDYKSDADLVVYKANYKSDASGNRGVWYFTKYKSDADVVVYFTEYKSDADLIIYFSDYKSDAGWRNPSKRYLLE